MIDVNNFEAMKIGLASAEQIKEWSYGEVKKPETINYRTLKPERDGLFCEKIFGPVKDWECHCGKYKRVRFKGVICDKCGVEVTRSKVRRERMGHIELASPVTHIWYFKGVPSRIGLLLEMSPRVLEKIIYFANFVVIDPRDTPLEHKQLLTEMEYREAREKYGGDFVAMMGAEAIRELLRQIDLAEVYEQLRDDVKNLSGQKRSKAVKRLEVVDAFRKSGNKPEWMILEQIPVIPPELRPMVQLDGGRFATSDLNDLYRRVINRNNRLKRLLELGAPDIIVKNEKRMLQEAVDALIDNGRRGRPVTGPNNRPLKSLSDMLKGKQGRFRQNLLGKRVDYSGRSVIVVGPQLKLHQCGLPKEMALELFKPFVMKKLVERGLVHNIKSAKKMVERMRPDVWDVLEEVIEDHPVLLNRAPTLHRLGIQAFEPVLVEGKAIQIHPLVCHPYNADFDGDQMAVHLPLSAGAQAEARLLMLSSNNILQPSYGSPATVPAQDLVLGIYYMTYCCNDDWKVDREGKRCYRLKGEGKVFSSMGEAIYAYDQGIIELQAPIKVMVPDFIDGEIEAEPDENGYYDDTPFLRRKLVETTVGRLLFHKAIPGELRLGATVKSKFHPRRKLILWNVTVTKGRLIGFVSDFHFNFKSKFTAYFLDNIKELGFHYATKSGTTVSVIDLAVPPKKAEILKDSETQAQTIEEYFLNGWTTDSERDEQIIEIWQKATKDVEKAMMDNMASLNPIFMMATSGARGNTSQVKQLAGMRGLMSDPSGKTIPLPIKANFREGLSVIEYFISTHGARKGLADTALRTADSGYLTRRLIDISQDIIIREIDCQKRIRCHDCETVNAYGDIYCSNCVSKLDYDDTGNEVAVEGEHMIAEAFRASDEPGMPCRLFERIRGRVVVQDVKNPATGDIMVEYGDLITDRKAEEISKAYSDYILSQWDEYCKNNEALVDEDESREFSRFIRNFPNDKKDIHFRSVLSCKTRHGVCATCYGRDLSTGEMVEIGETVGIIAAQSIGEPGTQLTLRTFHTGGVAESDIIQGLPRVEELFEARKPKRYAYIAEISGTIRFDEAKGLRQIVVENSETGDSWHVNIPFSTRLKVKEGDYVKAGTMLSEGSKNPHDILRVQGVREVQRYLVDEVQEVYQSQGVDINDKHVEVIVRQMLRKVKVETAGDTNLLPGSLVDIFVLEDENREAVEKGLEEATVRPTLLGVTKASLATDSFLSAASFQETTRVLTDAAIKGKVDNLVGLKENVIIGKMIPAGTGMPRYRSIRVTTTVASQGGTLPEGDEEPMDDGLQLDRTAILDEEEVLDQTAILDEEEVLDQTDILDESEILDRTDILIDSQDSDNTDLLDESYVQDQYQEDELYSEERQGSDEIPMEV